ncbi:ribosomal-protein-L7/L12-serine acetyltransferase [Streptomyces sp. YIM 130001]|uniref:GNAT family N-acetyltransferase n=1 Tax=Streptomyces sp. YIM 130001 TaxID=2259644 RepID=UPI000E65E456|nr:GNAT family N-acetyltransferase [Streptomyces sp. YIM 130001]RII19870.1 ribosomal-protein-L7/L12-serine acetyltransferase [Streptomyces sp. YIM 130001]
MEPITLSTERLLLRTPVAADTPAVFEACQDPMIQRWTTVPSPYARVDAEIFTERLVPDGWRDSTMYTLAAFRHDAPASGDIVAMLGLSARGTGVFELGFWAHPRHRGNGYTVEASDAFCRWGMQHHGMDRIEWRAEVGNHASRAVAEKSGFSFEGTLRSAILNHGTWRDCWIGSLLPADLGLPSHAPYLPAPS